MKNIAAILVSILGICSSNAFASLISLGPVSLGGQGLGSVQTILTIQSPGSSSTETGCVASGIGGVLVTGAAACPGGGPFGGPSFPGGNEQAQNNTFSASALGLTDFNNLRIIFNPSEPANAPSISLDNLALTLWPHNRIDTGRPLYCGASPVRKFRSWSWQCRLWFQARCRASGRGEWNTRRVSEPPDRTCSRRIASNRRTGNIFDWCCYRGS